MPKTEVSKTTGKTVIAGGNRTGTKNGPNSQKPGRTPTPIDWNQVGILAALHATQAELGGYFGLSATQIAARYEMEHGEPFSDFVGMHRDSGKAKLRVMQLESAKKGSVPMQIFLGKNWLEQSEKVEHYAKPEPIIIERLNGDTLELGSEFKEDI